MDSTGKASTVSDDRRADGPSPWRQRVRDIAIRDIMRTARGLLSQVGGEGLTVRAVARELGMSSQAMYRYFRSHDELMAALLVDVLGDMVDHLSAAAEEQSDAPASTRLTLVCRALRQWAIDHPYEFQLTMVTPRQAAATKPPPEEIRNARNGFGAVFAGLFAGVWSENDGPKRLGDESLADLRTAGQQFRQWIEVPVSDEIAAVFLRCWVRLYGVICMEAMGQLAFLGEETGALFEAELRDMAHWLDPRPAA